MSGADAGGLAISDGVDIEAGEVPRRMAAPGRGGVADAWPRGTDVGAIAAAVAEARASMAAIIADAHAFRMDCEARLASIHRRRSARRPRGRASMGPPARAASLEAH
jgi:hypothetical protein